MIELGAPKWKTMSISLNRERADVVTLSLTNSSANFVTFSFAPVERSSRTEIPATSSFSRLPNADPRNPAAPVIRTFCADHLKFSHSPARFYQGLRDFCLSVGHLSSLRLNS